MLCKNNAAVFKKIEIGQRLQNGLVQTGFIWRVEQHKRILPFLHCKPFDQDETIGAMDRASIRKTEVLAVPRDQFAGFLADVAEVNARRSS